MNYYFAGFIFLVFNASWMWVAKKMNGGLNKDEVGILLLGNLAIYQGCISNNEISFGITLAAFIGAIGLKAIIKK